MNYCTIKTCDIANGEGVRTSLFVSGCTNHCEECFQPETWDFNFGEEFTSEVADKIIETAQPNDIVITMGGGDIYKAAHIVQERLK